MTTAIPWQDWEVEALKTAWPRGALKAAQAALPHRSANSLRGRAERLGLKMAGRAVYRKQPASEWIDAALRREYRNAQPNLAKLSKELDRTRGWLKWRAGVLGIRKQARPYNRRWEPEEQRILEACIDAGHGVATIHKRLHKAGYARALTAILARLNAQNLPLTRNYWTANDVAALFALEVHSVLAWIHKGWLPAKRTPGPSCCDEIEERRQMYAITASNVRKFMLAYPHAWDHRRMRIEVLLDLLCGGEDGLASGAFGAASHG